jgi:hypothetical protein
MSGETMHKRFIAAFAELTELVRDYGWRFVRHDGLYRDLASRTIAGYYRRLDEQGVAHMCRVTFPEDESSDLEANIKLCDHGMKRLAAENP